MSRIRTSLWSLLLAASPLLLSQSDPNAVNTLIEQAVQFQQAGRYSQAANAYREVLKARPDDVATHVNLGVVLVNLGRFDEAIAQYEAAAKLLPGDQRIALNIALAYEKSGRLTDAQKRFEALHAAEPENTKVTMLLADCHLQLGEDPRVIELLEPLESTNPEDLGLAYMLGIALLHQHRMEQGQVLLDRILSKGDTPAARFLLGTRMFESGDFPTAVKQFAGAIELNPHLPQLQSYYGQALLETGDPAAAAKAFREELSTNPSDFRSNLGLAQILTAQKEYAQAVPLLQHALVLHPKSADAQLALAQCLSASGEASQARSYAEFATAAMPGSAEAHATLAAIYQKLRLSAQAAHERQRALALTAAADPGPKPNELAPDFELSDAASGRKVSLHDFVGKGPLVLIFGSYSCPNFRGSADQLTAMYQRYRSRVPFLLVYIREAHAGADWQSTRNVREGVNLAPAATYSEKRDHAAMCSRRLHLPFPAVVDDMGGTTEKAYNSWPSRVFVVGENGRIVYSTRLTALDFHSSEMEAALRQVTASRQALRK